MGVMGTDGEEVKGGFSEGFNLLEPEFYI